MTGRVFIVTGASCGIGEEVARQLCEGGNDVILACRSKERTNSAIDRIRKSNPSALASYMQLDLADLSSVRKFVDDFHATGKKLSVLINNAGVFVYNKENKREFTIDNFELTMGTNHLGHFLLTNLLLNDLKQTAAVAGGDARIVVVASSMHDIEVARKRGPVAPLDVDDLFLTREGAYNSVQAYKNSKLANILFTYELSRRLEDTGVKVNAVCPGFIPETELMRDVPGSTRFFCRYVLHGVLRFARITRSTAQGAELIVSLALSDKYRKVSGKYIREGGESMSSDESLDIEKQRKVWQLSAGYTHLQGYEPLDPPSVNQASANSQEQIMPTNEVSHSSHQQTIPINEASASSQPQTMPTNEASASLQKQAVPTKNSANCEKDTPIKTEGNCEEQRLPTNTSADS